jgi:hypothetical protein
VEVGRIELGEQHPSQLEHRRLVVLGSAGDHDHRGWLTQLDVDVGRPEPELRERMLELTGDRQLAARSLALAGRDQARAPEHRLLVDRRRARSLDRPGLAGDRDQADAAQRGLQSEHGRFASGPLARAALRATRI